VGHRRRQGRAAPHRDGVRGRAAGGRAGLRRHSDTAPSTTEGVAFPIHVLAINAMGVRLLDYLQLEDLRQACEAARRWEFLFMAAPLRIVGGTGSPLNPIAVLLCLRPLPRERYRLSCTPGAERPVDHLQTRSLPVGRRGRRASRPERRRPSAQRAAARARRLVGAEGLSDERMDELGSAFVTHHVEEGGGQLATWALAQGPFGLDPGGGGSDPKGSWQGGRWAP
jgi:hypothetical protein